MCAHKAVLVTTNGFTKDAVDAAQSRGIALLVIKPPGGIRTPRPRKDLKDTFTIFRSFLIDKPRDYGIISVVKLARIEDPSGQADKSILAHAEEFCMMVAENRECDDPSSQDLRCAIDTLINLEDDIPLEDQRLILDALARLAGDGMRPQREVFCYLIATWLTRPASIEGSEDIFRSAIDILTMTPRHWSAPLLFPVYGSLQVLRKILRCWMSYKNIDTLDQARQTVVADIRNYANYIMVAAERLPAVPKSEQCWPP